jgi:hypothetical protein
MSGALGAHVFEPDSFPDNCSGKKCKIFRPSLEIRDENGNVGRWTGTIKVYDPNSTGPNGWGDANETICISKVGNFAGCPLASPVARRVKSSATVQSLLKTYAGSQRRILFHAGETWNMTESYRFEDSHNGPSMLGSYGNGRATFNHSGMSSHYGRFTLRPDNWRIQDIEHRGSDGAETLYGADRQVKNLLIQRTRIANGTFGTGLTMAMQWIPKGPDHMAHRHIFLVDNEWKPTVDGNYQFFGAAWGLNLLGNTFGRSHSHNVRTQTGEAVLISNNILGPQKPGRAVLNLRTAPLGSCSGCESCKKNSTCAPLCERPPRYFLIQDNQFFVGTGDGIGHGRQSCGPTNPTNLASYDHIIERNFFRVDPAGLGGSLQSMAAFSTTSVPRHRFVIRNNILDETGFSWATGFNSGSGTSVYNNTCYRSDASGSGKAVCVSGAMDECYNNVLYAPRWSGTRSWRNLSASCKLAARNYDNGNTGNISRNPFVSANPKNSADFTPAQGSQLVDSAREISGLFEDQLSHCRLGTADVGALERGAAAKCGQDPGEQLGRPGKPSLHP